MNTDNIKNNNIALFVPTGLLGGAEKYLFMLTKYYLKHDYNVYLYIAHYNTNSWDSLRCKKLKIYYGRKGVWGGIFYMILKIILNMHIKYETLYTSNIHMTCLVGIMRKIKIVKTKYFIARESTSIFIRYDGLKLLTYLVEYYIGYDVVDLLICQTDTMKKQLVNALPWMNNRIKIVTIYNAIDLNGLDINSNNEHYPCDIDLNCEYIVTAGRLIYEKGFDILIQAFSYLKINNPFLRLIILGDGQVKEQLKRLTKSLSLENDILFLGHKRNVIPYFKIAKVCVIPSRIEGFPNVLLEMMSQNIKIVCTKSFGGVEDINGIITCKTEDVNGLMESISFCLSSEGNNNRIIFDDYLNSRSIDSVVKEINNNLY